MLDLCAFAVAHPLYTAAVILFCRLYFLVSVVELAAIIAAEELAALTEEELAAALRLWVEEQDAGPCPDRQTLAAYQAGNLPQAAAEELLEHVCLCRACVDEITRHDTPHDTAVVLHDTNAAAAELALFAHARPGAAVLCNTTGEGSTRPPP